MSKSIHQQIIDGTGTISFEGTERDFNLPECMTMVKDHLQDEDALVRIYKDSGILLNVFHQAFGQMRVNWSADVKRQAKLEGNDFKTLKADCSINWVPPVQGLPKTKSSEMSEDEMLKKLAKKYSPEQLLELLTSNK